MSSTTPPCRVSIVIKALNEQDNICDAIESCLAALGSIPGEVILADSCSTDRTVELASRYPVKVVQFTNVADRGCGAGPQLGYQHSSGEYVYLMDGDMKLVPGFLEHALAFLAQHPEVAGVGGRVVEQNLESMEYRERHLRAAPHLQPGQVDRLDGGGLYRRRAIQESGYLSDRNLHSYEEFDLAVRLRALGWRLWRLPADAVTHYGHDAPPYKLLMRRWKSRYACGLGEMVRGAIWQPRMRLVLRDLRELRLYLGVLGWWLVLLAAIAWPAAAVTKLVVVAAVALGPLVAMALRKRSLARAAYSVSSWCVNTAGLVRGFLAPRKPAQDRIASRILKEPEPAGGAVPTRKERNIAR